MFFRIIKKKNIINDHGIKCDLINGGCDESSEEKRLKPES